MKTQVLKKPALNQLLEQKRAFLSEDEILSLGLLSDIKVHDYLAGRYTLKILLASILEDTINPTTVSVTYRDKRPVINFKNTQYHCSISHSKEHVACSIDSLHLNGIDIEELKERSVEFQEYIIDQDDYLSFGTKQPFLATRIWSIKEAAFKSDTHQTALTNYTIRDRSEDFFLVENNQTKHTTQVKNKIIDNYTVSYTIPHTL